MPALQYQLKLRYKVITEVKQPPPCYTILLYDQFSWITKSCLVTMMTGHQTQAFFG